MDFLLIVAAAFTQSIQSILKRRFNERAHGGVFLFCAISSALACLFFIITATDLSFKPEQALMSVAFATAYCTSTVFSTLAIKHGPLAQTNLILSYSLLLPTFFGIIFMKEPVKATLYMGIVVLAAALFLTNYQRKKRDGDIADGEKVSLKWIIFVILAFIGNGMCSIVQNIETSIYGESGKSVFMIIALAMVSTFFTVCTFATRAERVEIKHNFKCGWLLAVLCGAANGLTNFLVLYLLTRVPSSVMFPIISAGGMLFVYIYSVIALKEKYSRMQNVGYILGVLSIVLLNL